MNVLLAGNDTYAFGTKVLLVSLLENCKGRSVSIYFMYNRLQEKNKNEFKQIVGRYNGCSIKFIYLSMKMFENVPLTATTNPYITVETYFRMAMSQILPESVDRILYLDTDIIVNNCISEFYDQPMEERIVACVCDDFGITMADKLRKMVYANLKFEEEDRYFNAGVLLLNMKCVRENYSFGIFQEFIRQNYEKLMFHDQDVLNALFKNRVKYVDYNQYNCRPFYYAYTKKMENMILENACIIHYGEKPWNSDFTDLAAEAFWKYADIAGFEEEHRVWSIENAQYKKTHRAKIIFKHLKRNLKMLMM